MKIFISVLFLAVVSGVLWLVKKRASKAARPQPDLTDWDLKCMAYHEAGHAVCSYFLPEREKLITITIDPTSEAFGMIRTEPRSHHNETQVSFSSMISTLLAGRLAEEMFLDTISTSCVHDLAAARSIAGNMVINLGMGKNLGVCTIPECAYTSEEYKKQICQDIQAIMQAANSRARKVLADHRALVAALAETLLERRTLAENEITAFFQSHGEK